MAEMKQMIIAMRLHIKIISPCALNISSVSLSDGDYVSEISKQTNTFVSPLMISWMALRSDMRWCNGWQAGVLTLPWHRLMAPDQGLGWFLLTRDHSVAPHPSQPEPLWTNSNKNSLTPHYTGYGSKETVQHQSGCSGGNQPSSAAIQRSIFMIKDRTGLAFRSG